MPNNIEKFIAWDRATHDYSVNVAIDGVLVYLGNTQTRSEAEQRANSYVFDYLMDTGTFESAASLLMGA